ncbi:serine protease inhibitor 3-like [Ceratina calcarata]|uniref:Serine protease inhibitor 3-like n=1 Tax=Ceratina calcarata TaxID=156304 RepID=A0AAJ7SB45_9HYME|nr:serine protease inhibitor 3-like [Ceratina calcarata]
MSVKVFALLFSLFLVQCVVTAAPHSQFADCVPGTTFFNGCATCTCQKNGALSCPLVACQKYANYDSSMDYED